MRDNHGAGWLVDRYVLNTLLAALMVITPPVAPSPEAQLQQNIAQYQALIEDLAITVQQTDVIRRQISGLETQMKQRRATVGRLAQASYRSYRADSLNVLLDPESTSAVRDRLQVLNTFAQYRRTEIKDLAKTRERFTAAQRTLESLIEQQRSQRQTLGQQRAKIDAQLAAQKRRP